MPKSSKRSAPAPSHYAKKRKVANASKSKPKVKASKPTEIHIPAHDGNDDDQLSNHDLELLDEYAGATTFLENLDHKGIARSKFETDRLHALNKPKRPFQKSLSLSSVSSDESISYLENEQTADEFSSEGEPSNEVEQDSDEEMDYEKLPRKRQKYWEDERTKAIPRLPIKLPTGQIQQVEPSQIHVVQGLMDASSEPGDDSDTKETPIIAEQVGGLLTGARFGRPAVVDVVQSGSRRARISAAKEQIASLCQKIISDPENSLGLLRHLHTFSLTRVSIPNQPRPVLNDPIIRKLAIVSQLAVFMDIIPGYRIRALTDKEKTEKVSQMVAQTRDWEQGLVLIYQNYLKSLEVELRDHSEVADVALQCMCTLLAERTHFNFRVNLVNCIVARLSRRSLDKSGVVCLETIIKVFRADLTGQPSLEIVQVLNRMVKERHFQVDPEVLSSLLHLRLKTELGVRASDTRAEKKSMTKDTIKNGRARAKAGGQVHTSKRAKKVLREKKEIEHEFREAEAEVDKEERARVQTETLKLSFVLYFRILKHPTPTPLLPAALNGISKFAHLVNIDFFKDLMSVLKSLVDLRIQNCTRNGDDAPDTSNHRDTRHRLLCIITAFELLSGQGEALNIELSDFVIQLYKLILPLSHAVDINDDPPQNTPTASSSSSLIPRNPLPSLSDLLFRALNYVFSPRAMGTMTTPPWSSAAFSKRLLTACLHWPGEVALQTLDFVSNMVAKEAKLETLLSTEDRIFDGVYRPDVDDPQVSNPFGTMFYELHLLARYHCDIRVRTRAANLINFHPIMT